MFAIGFLIRPRIRFPIDTLFRSLIIALIRFSAFILVGFLNFSLIPR